MGLLEAMEIAKNSPISSYHSYLLNHKYPMQIHAFLDYPINKIPFQFFEESLNDLKFFFYRFELQKTNSQMIKRILSLEHKNSFIFFIGSGEGIQDLISKDKLINLVLENHENHAEKFYESLPLERIISEPDWTKLNEKRIKLIWQRYHNEISNEELKELEKLQKFCQIYINRKSPLPIDFIKKLIEEGT